MAKKLIPTAPVTPVSPTLSGALANKSTPVVKAPTTTPAVSSITPTTSTAKKGGIAPLAPFASMKTGIETKKMDPVPTAPITNAAMGGNNPSTGYGGAQYGTSADANKAITANQSMLASDPTYRQKEIDRTQGVIAERSAQGLDTSEQLKYLEKNLKYAPNQNANAANGVPFSGSTDANYTNYGQYVPGNTAAPPSWATAEEETWLKNQIAGMQGLSDTYKGQLNSALDQNNSYVGQQIDAAQQMQNRRGGLFSGGYDYQAGTLTSEGLKRQADLQNQYGNQISSIAQQINNLQQAQPEILRQRIQEYVNNDRNYALNYANTFGNLGGVNTQSMQGQLFNQDMAGQQFDWQKAMDQANLTGQYNGQSTLAGKQANWNAYMDMVNQTGQLGKGPAQNWTNYVANANAGNQTMGGQQNASNLVSEQQNRDLATRQAALQEWQTTGSATPNVAAILGVPQGTLTSDQAYRDAGMALDQDKFTYSQMYDTANLQNKQNQQQQQTVSAATAGDMLSSALQKVVGVDADGKQKLGTLTDPQAREDAFVNMINTTGISGNDAITALSKAGYTMTEINALQKEYPEVFQ